MLFFRKFPGPPPDNGKPHFLRPHVAECVTGTNPFILFDFGVGRLSENDGGVLCVSFRALSSQGA